MPLPLLAQSGGTWIDALTRLAPPGNFFWYSYNVHALLALVLVSLTCGAVGSLVVGGRMAFFSDALAHCAFASVSVGFVVFTVVLAGMLGRPPGEFWDWITPLMLALGMLVGLGIAWVRQRTRLASDTVIGVFFAGAIGLAAMLRKIIAGRNPDRSLFKLEDFLFGEPLAAQPRDLFWLAVLAVLTAVTLAFIYNHLLLASFNPSLALSRRVPVQLSSYVFIILLALIVNLCVRIVGALLINALLVVPAATAANCSRNLRQLFWITVAVCLFCCLAGQALQWQLESRWDVRITIPGVVVLLSVVLFGLSMLVGPLLRRPVPPAPAVSRPATSAR